MAKSKGSAGSTRRPTRGGAVPSPKKLKQQREKLAVEAAAGKRAAPEAVGSALAVDQVAELADSAADKLSQYWRVIVAATAIAAVILGLLWLRSERARSHNEEAWAALATAERGDKADDPEHWRRLADDYAGTTAAVFMQLREADALVRRGTPEDLSRAREIYDTHRAALGLEGFLGREGEQLADGYAGFKPTTPPAETAPGLAPLEQPEAGDTATTQQP